MEFTKCYCNRKKKSLQAEIQKTLLELRHRYRAVTTKDYEQLVLEDWNQSPESNGLTIARVKCLAQRNNDRDPDKYWRQAKIAQAIIDREKPAQTFYSLRILIPTMRIPQTKDDQNKLTICQKNPDETYSGTTILGTKTQNL